MAIGLRTSEVYLQNFEEVLKIVVHNHKTGKIKPAVLFMKDIAKQAMLNFKEVILPKVSCEESQDHYFLSYNGKIITHAGVQSSLNILAKLIGSPDKITATGSRKAAATFIATTNPNKTQIVADFMQHQHQTAEKYYRQLGGGDHLIKAYEEIGKLSELESSSTAYFKHY